MVYGYDDGFVQSTNFKNIGGIAVHLVEYNTNPKTYGVEFNGKPVDPPGITDIATASMEYAAIPQGAARFPGGYKTIERPSAPPGSSGGSQGQSSEQAPVGGTSAISYSTPSWVMTPDPFRDTFTWISFYFKLYVDEIYYPRFLPGYQLDKVNGIVQRANPSPNQASPNENTYQWDISYSWIAPDGSRGDWEETFYYKTAPPYYSMDNQNSKFALSMGRNGSLAVGATGYTKLEGGVDVNPDTPPRVVVIGTFAMTNTKSYEIEIRVDEYYVICYKPGDDQNVVDVLGPFTTQAEAQAAADAHVDAYTIDIINDEREAEAERRKEDDDGQGVSDVYDSSVSGDLGTVSGAISDRPSGFKYELIDVNTWTELVEMGIIEGVDITGAFDGTTIDLAGMPFFGTESAGSYGFDKATFTVAMGYKVKFNLKCDNFDVEGEYAFSRNETDFELDIIMEGGDFFELDMGDRQDPARLSIILDGVERSPYEASATSIVVDRSARMKLLSTSMLVDDRNQNLPEGFTPQDLEDTGLDDIINPDPTYDPPPQDDQTKPDPRPGPNPEPEPQDDDNGGSDEASSSTFANIGVAALVGLVLILVVSISRGRMSGE